MNFETWLAEVSKLVNIPIEQLQEDELWYWCYTDDYSPEKAASEYQASEA